MIVDGRALAQRLIADIAKAVAGMSQVPRLAVFTCAPNFETQKFLAIKERQAKQVGVMLERYELSPEVTIAEVAALIKGALLQHDGIIIQFPFPHIATTDLLPLIPVSHDVDVFQYAGSLTNVLPPVVGAIDVISQEHAVSWNDKLVVIVGNGRLVGAPVAQYAQARGAQVVVLTKESFDYRILAAADIVVLGAGVPGLITRDMVRDGVIVFDAGTSEEGGQLRGDADAQVAEKAALFTPVPGGIGPLTVAVLLRNLIELSRRQ